MCNVQQKSRQVVFGAASNPCILSLCCSDRNQAALLSGHRALLAGQLVVAPTGQVTRHYETVFMLFTMPINQKGPVLCLVFAAERLA